MPFTIGFSYKTIILSELFTTVFDKLIFHHGSFETTPKYISLSFMGIRKMLSFRFIPLGFIFEHSIGLVAVSHHGFPYRNPSFGHKGKYMRFGGFSSVFMAPEAAIGHRLSEITPKHS